MRARSPRESGTARLIGDVAAAIAEVADRPRRCGSNSRGACSSCCARTQSASQLCALAGVTAPSMPVIASTAAATSTANINRIAVLPDRIRAAVLHAGPTDIALLDSIQAPMQFERQGANGRPARHLPPHLSIRPSFPKPDYEEQP